MKTSVSSFKDSKLFMVCDMFETYPMARIVRDQAKTAAEDAAPKLSALHDRIWFSPEIDEAAPATAANKANVTKKPVAAFPMGK